MGLRDGFGLWLRETRVLAMRVFAIFAVFAATSSAFASEADLNLPDLASIRFLGGSITGWDLLCWGLLVCVLGMLFGGVMFNNLKNLPVHKSMRDISELIYETCKTYVQNQMKFLGILWLFIGFIIFVYFGWLKPVGFGNVLIILFFSLVGIAGSVTVAWFGNSASTPSPIPAPLSPPSRESLSRPTPFRSGPAFPSVCCSFPSSC